MVIVSLRGKLGHVHIPKGGVVWRKVDLGNMERVAEVYIVDREAVGHRLSNFEILVLFFCRHFLFEIIAQTHPPKNDS